MMSQTTTQSIPSNESKEFLRLANKLADIAAEKTLTYFRQNPEISNKEGGILAFDPVTIADKEAEEAIVTEIKATYPDHSIIGEETGTLNNNSDYQWIIDPIDGTGSFVCGIPLWGTLISLTYKDAPVLGLMDQAFLGDRYIGLKDASVLIRDNEEAGISTSNCTSLKDARLSTTSPNLFTSDEKIKFDTVENKVKLTRYGTDCSAYALLAAGHIDLVIETGLNSYDICALIPIIEGAGGKIITWQGTPATKGGQIIAASTADLLEETLDLIR